MSAWRHTHGLRAYFRAGGPVRDYGTYKARMANPVIDLTGDPIDLIDLTGSDDDEPLPQTLVTQPQPTTGDYKERSPAFPVSADHRSPQRSAARKNKATRMSAPPALNGQKRKFVNAENRDEQIEAGKPILVKKRTLQPLSRPSGFTESAHQREGHNVLATTTHVKDSEPGRLPTDVLTLLAGEDPGLDDVLDAIDRMKVTKQSHRSDLGVLIRKSIPKMNTQDTISLGIARGTPVAFREVAAQAGAHGIVLEEDTAEQDALWEQIRSFPRFRAEVEQKKFDLFREERDYPVFREQEPDEQPSQPAETAGRVTNDPPRASHPRRSARLANR